MRRQGGFTMTFKEKLVILRKMKGLTQDDFASAVGVSRQAVYKWECGQSYPEVPKLIEMKLLFGISLDNLLDDNYDIPLPEKKKKRISRAVTEKIEASVDSTTAAAAPTSEVMSAVAKAIEVKDEAPKAAPAPAAAPAPKAAPAPAAAPAPKAAPAPAAAPVAPKAAPAPAAAPAPKAEPAPAAAPAPKAEPAPAAAPAPKAEPAPAAAPAPKAEPAPTPEAAPAEEKAPEKKGGFFSFFRGKK